VKEKDIETAVINLFKMVIKELPVEIKTIIYTLLISFNNTKTENAYILNENIASIQKPTMAFRFEDGSKINTLVRKLLFQKISKSTEIDR
jgi:hypothetical protein